METYVRSLDAAKEALGTAALSDARAESVLADAVNEAARLARDIAEARTEAQAVARDMERFQEARLAERGGKKELDALRRSLVESQTRLGEAALASAEAPAGFEPFRLRIDAVAGRIEDLEARIAELENSTGEGGLIAHLGRSARTVFLRSSQTSRRAEGQRILAEAGAAIRGEALASEDEAVRAASEALTAQGEAIARAEAALAAVRTELKELTDRLQSVAGSPRRAVQRLEKAAEEGEGSLARLRRDVGERLLAAAGEASSAPHAKDPFVAFAAAFLSEGAVAAHRSAARSAAASIASAEKQIRKLEASIRIDALYAEVARLRSAVADHERRIAASKRAVEDMGQRISDAEREIAGLEAARGEG